MKAHRVVFDKVFLNGLCAGSIARGQYITYPSRKLAEEQAENFRDEPVRESASSKFDRYRVENVRVVPIPTGA